MKAIVLAAGEGSRLRPWTEDRPKCLVPWNGRPIFDRLVETLHGAGIEDIVVVGGYRVDRLRRDGIRLLENERWATTNMVHTLMCAEKELEGDVVVTYSDIVYGQHVLAALDGAPGDVRVAVDLAWRELWTRRFSDPLSDAETLRMDAEGHITELGRRPAGYGDVEGQYIGVVRLTDAGCRAVRRLWHSLPVDAVIEGRPRDRMFMTALLQTLIDSGVAVSAAPFSGGWIEVDAPSDLDVVMVERGP